MSASEGVVFQFARSRTTRGDEDRQKKQKIELADGARKARTRSGGVRAPATGGKKGMRVRRVGTGSRRVGKVISR